MNISYSLEIKYLAGPTFSGFRIKSGQSNNN